MVNSKRVRSLNDATPGTGPVVYWMSRDQRVRDNWALLHAQEIALQSRRPLAVVFCLVPSFLGATLRQYGFMLRGLTEVEQALEEKNIPFFLVHGDPGKEIPGFAHHHQVGVVVTDFSPLRLARQWQKEVAEKITVSFRQVDAHNIVPCWVASSKAEFAAYTMRPKLHRLFPEFFQDFPALRKQPFPWVAERPAIDWEKVKKKLPIDFSVPEVNWIKPGERGAHLALKYFLDHKLDGYHEARNDPNRDGQSNLSPYLHFGQLAPQRVAWEVRQHRGDNSSVEAFLEELMVRRELADNFCFYNPRYDDFSGFPPWAQKTLNEHRRDRREQVYTLEEFEQGQTHDDLWNAAQFQMVQSGKMSGYLRMYWAKKILEWSRSPEEALRVAIYLNDRYELDGRDPNGYGGIAWSLGGVHDRAWFDRPIFGKIRYMSYNGCRKKFDVPGYIKMVKDSGNPWA